MTRPWTGLFTRRAAAGLALGAAALLAGCGSGSVVSDLQAERFIAVGDGFSDVGQTGQPFTVADGSRTWLQQLASYYGLTVTPAATGGWGYAQGHARVDSPDPGGAPSVKEQVDQLLADTTLDPKKDVVFINGGMNDIVAAVEATGASSAETKAAIDAAARALADQAKRVEAAGARHIVVVGVYNLCRSPWGYASHIDADYEDCTPALTFNNRLLTELVDMGATTLYFDAALFYNLIQNRPDNYPVDNVTQAVCTTPDAGTCTPSTLRAGVTDYNRWMFADGLHFTPTLQRIFVSEDYAENAFTRLKNRW